MMFRSHIIFIIEDKIFMQDPIHFTWSVMIKAGVRYSQNTQYFVGLIN